MKAVRWPLLVAVCAMSFLAKDTLAESEDAVKAALLFNFAKFTVWPDSAFSGDKLVVGFVGSNSLGLNAISNLRLRLLHKGLQLGEPILELCL